MLKDLRMGMIAIVVTIGFVSCNESCEKGSETCDSTVVDTVSVSVTNVSVTDVSVTADSAQ